MEFKEIELKGAYVIKPTKFEDHRGEFFRSYCSRLFEQKGLKFDFVQTNISKNYSKGTLRGMHYQKPPYSEVKLIRCLKGAIYDVIIDVRENSQTFGKWYGIELTEKNDFSLYVPEGFAHGFLTFEDETVIMYQVSNYYTPEAEFGIKYDDNYFNIDWKYPILNVSAKDENHKLWNEKSRRIRV